MAFSNLAQVEVWNASVGDNGQHSMDPATVQSVVIENVRLPLQPKVAVRLGISAVDLLVRVGRDNADETGFGWLADVEAAPDQIGKYPRSTLVKAVLGAANGLVSDGGVRLQSEDTPLLLRIATEPVDPETDPNQIHQYPGQRLVKAALAAGRQLISQGNTGLQSVAASLPPPHRPTTKPMEPLMEWPVLRLPMVAEALRWSTGRSPVPGLAEVSFIGESLLLPQVDQGQVYVDMPSIEARAVQMRTAN